LVIRKVYLAHSSGGWEFQDQVATCSEDLMLHTSMEEKRKLMWKRRGGRGPGKPS
jgi:hypothetical protein